LKPHQLLGIIGREGYGNVVASVHQHDNIVRINIFEDRTDSQFKSNYWRGVIYHKDSYRNINSGPNYYAPSWIIEATIKLGINMCYVTCKSSKEDFYQLIDTNWELEELINKFPEYKFYTYNNKMYIGL